jgi:branched-chain amino acid transport system ATP-binding protein
MLGRRRLPSDAEHRVEKSGPILKVTDLSAGYGGVPVVRGVNLHVNPGEMVALLGPNGAGKSTTLSTICGDLAAMTGSIQWRGVASSPPSHVRARNGLAFVMEGRSIIATLSVAHNLRLGRGTVDDALTIIPELRPLLNRKAGLLSGGEQQMLALARALAGEPDVLMVDELSMGLAPMIVDRLMATLQTAVSRGTGVLLVEQHVRKALRVADRVYVLRRGEVALTVDGAEIRDKHELIENLYLSDQAS